MTLTEAQQGAAETGLLLIITIICLAAVAITALCCGYSESLIVLIVGALAGVAGFTGGAFSVWSKTRNVLKRKE
jgi:1,4-dihydroxy-2-naphthoate octaprenyltransferase